MGELVLGRFQVEQRLGSGGFGTVYRAWDARLERDVAVKVIDGEEELGRRVLREAQAAARLNHRGIAMLYELGEEDGKAFLVSELVEGDTLRRLSLDGQLSDRDIGEVGADLCEALDHAHSRGVVHRDIKPQNVLVCERGPQAKLLDFGIARMLDAAPLTATGSVVGTLAYMSPEQAEGRPAGPEADVFALALTLYECWSGENPHLRDTPAATARAIGSPLPSLGRRRRDLPPPLTDAIDAALDPVPERRPSLEQLGGAIESSLEQLRPRPGVPPARGTSLRARPAGGSRRGLALDAAVAAALSALVGAAFVTAAPRGPAWALLLVPLVAALALIRPRLGYLVAVLGVAGWLALAAARPGAALVLCAVALPPFFLLPRAERGLVAPASAPLLGAMGLALAFPLLAALAQRWRERAVIAATGVVWLGLSEIVLRRDLLLGAEVHPPRGWQQSAAAGAGDLLLPFFADLWVPIAIAAAATAALLAGALLAPFRARVGAGAATGLRPSARRNREPRAARRSDGERRPTLP